MTPGQTGAVGSLIISPCLAESSDSFGSSMFQFVEEDGEVEGKCHEIDADVPLKHHGDLPRVTFERFDRCGLQGPEPSDSSCDLSAASLDLVCHEPRRVRVFAFEQFFNSKDEVSVERQLEPFAWGLEPLLSQVAEQTDSSWWLLDSGASTSVLAQSSVSAFNAAIAKENQSGFLAANVSAVQMSGSTEIGVHMFMSDSQEDQHEESSNESPCREYST